MTEPLRVGVVLEGLEAPAWRAELVRAIAAEPEIECSLVVLGRAPSRTVRSLPAWYHAFDRLVDRGRSVLFRPVRMTELGLGIRVLELEGGADRDGPTRDVAESLRRARLDVLLLLGLEDSFGEAAGAVRHGIWTLRLGDGIRYLGDLPGFWEMADGSPVTGAVLEVRRTGSGPRVIDRTTPPVDRHTLLRTRSLLVAASINMVVRRLRHLRDRGWPFLESQTVPLGPGHAPPAPRTPHGPLLLGLMVRTCLRVVRRFLELSLRDEFHWSVVVASRPPAMAAGDLVRRGAFRRLDQAADEFLADPFLFEREGRSYLFMERFCYRTGRAVIAVCELGPGGTPGALTTALERPYHLSYPCVFSHRGELFMIPETGSQRTIELYRCERFPDRWVHDRTLFEGLDAADATIMEIEDRFWMFVCIASRGMSADTELHLFHAEAPRGPWRPHPLNPVVSDVRSARPAGRPWREGSQLIRPAQDCSVRYGYALCFNRITTLTPEDYAEEPIDRVTPDQLAWQPRAEGIHTWNSDDRFSVTDVTRSRFRFPR